MSDNGSNFVGANREIREIVEFLNLQKTEQKISQFCSSEHIQWRFIPERAPHFGGIWEAAVKSMKIHLRRVIGEHKLTFEELYTVITQVESCLNSRPLSPLPDSKECLEVLTPGHFLIGQPLESLPDPSASFQSIPLKRWHLVQALVRHFWQRWSTEYLTTLARVNKWHRSSPNLNVGGDIVVLREDALVMPSKWPLARVMETHIGRDGYVRVVTIKTANGIYKRPITQLVPLISSDS